MGIFKKLMGGDKRPASPPASPFPPPVQATALPPPLPLPSVPAPVNRPGERPGWMIDGVSATLYHGPETLEVVGESYRQDNLWRLVGIPRTGERVQHDTVAILVPETGNEYDENAIAVWVNGLQVGYLSMDDAEDYRPGLDMLAASGPVALPATIVGGGYGDKLAILGVFLDHDPTDFGVSVDLYRGGGGELRTGWYHAFITDGQDDSYDLSWINSLSGDTRKAIDNLKSLLATEPDPIDRHFMFSELETRLYKLRDVETTALTDYDAACAQHDTEMDHIRPALHGKFGAIPLLETYKQQCVRQQKAKDFRTGLWWAERGLALYGADAYSQDWIDDLRKRAAAFTAKLEAPPPRVKERPAPNVIEVATEHETLACTRCGTTWERMRVRGRKPLLCPSCARPG